MILEREDPPIQHESFGKYELLRRLGRGMADVYLAYHPDLNRRVVLKIIERASNESNTLSIEAERRGAELQRRLHDRDKRVLEIYETGELGGCFFVAMQYFPGRTIAEMLRAERILEPVRAARLAAEICSQLRTLHGFLSTPLQKTAVVHGDIKPSNIQVGAHDELRLLDFGIAKLIRAGQDLTHHQLGSPSYCSPERLRNSQVDVHSDLWALAVTLYEMLAGVPPFQAQDTRELERLIQARRSSLPLPATCPPALKAILAKGLASDAKKRYRSAAELEGDLNAFLSKHPPKQASVQTTVVRVSENVPRAEHPPAVIKRPRQDHATLAIALLAGLLAGLLLLIPATYYFQARRLSHTLSAPKDYVQSDPSLLAADWQLYQSLKNKSSFNSRFLDAHKIAQILHRNLANSAAGLITRFRQSSSSTIDRGAWLQAKRCLLYALAIEPNDRKSVGELHLCNGYLALSADQAQPAWALGFREFSRAAAFLPRSADPTLGLARIYFYGWHNVGVGLAELHQAQQTGYRLGPREIEEEADAYLYRADHNLQRAAQSSGASADQTANWLRIAHGDLERARNLYEPIAGFDGVDNALQKVGADLDQEAVLQNAQLAAERTSHTSVLLKVRFTKRWAWSHRR